MLSLSTNMSSLNIAHFNPQLFKTTPVAVGRLTHHDCANSKTKYLTGKDISHSLQPFAGAKKRNAHCSIWTTETGSFRNTTSGSSLNKNTKSHYVKKNTADKFWCVQHFGAKFSFSVLGYIVFFPPHCKDICGVMGLNLWFARICFATRPSWKFCVPKPEYGSYLTPQPIPGSARHMLGQKDRK